MNTNEDYDYYEYNAVVGGKITTVQIAASVDVTNVMDDGTLKSGVVNGLFKDAVYDKDVITGLDANGSVAIGTKKLDGEYTIALGNGADPNVFTKFTVAEDAKIFVIDEDGNIEAAELKNIQNDDNDYVNYVMDSDDNYIEYLFVQEIEDGTNDNTPNNIGVVGTSTTNAASIDAMKAEADGAYTFAAGHAMANAGLTGVDSTNIEYIYVFKFDTTKANQSVALEVKNTANGKVYNEGETFTEAGGHFFHVHSKAATTNGTNLGTGALTNTDWTAGTYTWSVKSSGVVLASGSFTIA